MIIFFFNIEISLLKGEILYQNYLNQQLIERAERESRNKGDFNSHVNISLFN